ncbi:MAG: DNA repair protein RadC [bacterium]|nr:DNA repair protein RadC [bacterium]
MRLITQPPHTRPREKLHSTGINSLSDAQVVALLIGSGSKGNDVIKMSENILSIFPLSSWSSCSYEALLEIPGVGPALAAKIIGTVAVHDRMSDQSEVVRIESPQTAAALFHYLQDKKQEHLVGLYLDARNRPIEQKTITIGTLNSNLIHPREVFAPALSLRAAGLIVAHNHPSGDPTPSSEDITATQRLCEAGEILNIPVLDHLIISNHGWKSLKQEQLM